MSKLAAFMGSNSAMVIGAGVFVIGSVGAGAYFGVLAPDDATQPAPVMVAQPAGQPEPAAIPRVASQPDGATPQAIAPEIAAETPQPRVPRVDEVRNEADGLTVIAGRAAPNSDVILFVDDVETITVQSGNDGAFAAITFLAPNGDPQVLRIIQRINGNDLAADDIIIAPRAAGVAQVEYPADPVVVAQTPTASPDPTPEVSAGATAQPETPDVTQSEPAQTEQVAVLKSDETGVEIINRSSAPDVMSNVAIDTISYSQDGDVLLSGRAQSQATAVRVYLDNAVIATLEVDASGRWRGDLPDVDTGIYTLRVDEVDTAGDVTSRVETPFKREAPAVLAAAQNAAQQDVDKPVKAITVQTGATLWAIARDRYGDGTLYVRVVDANKDSIRNPDLIYPGQVFELPE